MKKIIKLCAIATLVLATSLSCKKEEPKSLLDIFKDTIENIEKLSKSELNKLQDQIEDQLKDIDKKISKTSNKSELKDLEKSKKNLEKQLKEIQEQLKKIFS